MHAPCPSDCHPWGGHWPAGQVGPTDHIVPRTPHTIRNSTGHLCASRANVLNVSVKGPLQKNTHDPHMEATCMCSAQHMVQGACQGVCVSGEAVQLQSFKSALESLCHLNEATKRKTALTSAGMTGCQEGHGPQTPWSPQPS